MKNRKITILLISLIILIGSVIFFAYKNDKKIYSESKEDKITLAIMIERDEGKYIEYKSKKWPSYGYRFNASRTVCVDRDRNNLGNLIEYDARLNEAHMKSTKSAFCTLYFDRDNSAPVVSDGSFYVGSTIDQIYTSKRKEEVHIKIEDDDVIEYCLSLENDSRSCDNKWNVIPELTEGWFTVEEFNLGSTDGEKIVYLYLKDGARNISESTDTIILDTEGPNCKLWGESTSWTSSSRTIRWGCEDATSGCKVEEIGSREYTETTKTAPVAEYEIEDLLGNKTTCNVTANVYVDKSAPSCNIGGNTNTWSTSKTLTQNGEDNETGIVYYSWDNKNNYSTTKTTKTVTANGTYTLYVKDSLGNETSCTASVTKIDRNPPSCSIGGNTSTWSTSKTLTQNGEDAESDTVYYSWNNNNNYSTTKTTKTVTANGTYTLYVKDGLGNENSCSVSVTKIDKTGPDFTITNTSNGSAYSGGWTKYNVNSALTFSDGGAGIDASSLKWGTNGTTWTAISNTNTAKYDDTWSSERNGTAYYQICDTIGNCTTKSFTIKIDKTPPTIAVSNKTSDGSNYTGSCTTQNVISTVTYSDASPSSGINTSSFAWSDDNSTWHLISGAGSSSATDTWSANRTATVYYRICDTAENCNTVSFKLDKRSSCGGGGGGGDISTSEPCYFTRYFHVDEESDDTIAAQCSGTKRYKSISCWFISGYRIQTICENATCWYSGKIYAQGVSLVISTSSCINN